LQRGSEDELIEPFRKGKQGYGSKGGTFRQGRVGKRREGGGAWKSTKKVPVG